MQSLMSVEASMKRLGMIRISSLLKFLVGGKVSLFSTNSSLNHEGNSYESDVNHQVWKMPYFFIRIKRYNNQPMFLF